ncbi:MAG: hypothetical protein CL610_27025 [Anaerolineaceae bacterium]|nr:hypothetical protein [Anaerolineaceae bacterium]
MIANSYTFKVGAFDCTVVSDGVFLMGRDRFLRRYPDATEADYRQAFADIGLSFDEAASWFNVLVVKMGAHTVLVDAGEGGKPHGGLLLESLRLAQIEPEAITHVILTHSHGDHVLGLLNDDHQPVFPNATYVLSKPELPFWQAAMAAGADAQRPILDMIEQQGLRLIDMDEASILPGLSARPIPGHTPGQIALLFESGDERLLHAADLLHSPIQFAHPQWSATYDADTRQSVPTRWQTLNWAADEGLLTLFYHLPFPGVGHVRQASQGFSWHPIRHEQP